MTTDGSPHETPAHRGYRSLRTKVWAGMAVLVVFLGLAIVRFIGRTPRAIWLEHCFTNANMELRKSSPGDYECVFHTDPCGEDIATSAPDMETRCALRTGCIYNPGECVCYAQIFGRGLCACGGGSPQSCRRR
jgi:hypothetical protein